LIGDVPKNEDDGLVGLFELGANKRSA